MENKINNHIENKNDNGNNNIIDEQIMPDINDLIVQQKQFIDDEYLLQLHQRLGQTRELRKIAENGIKILNSRINCLESENQRTLSKINITSKKTNNKLLSMEQKRKQSQEKMEHLKKLENDLKILKKKNQNLKLERDNGLINSRKNVISQNKQKGKISKREKEDISNIKKMYDLNWQNMKKNNAAIIRNDLIPNAQIKKMVEISKKEQLIKDLEDKINYEINKKEEIEENINKMKQDEKDTLERIKKLEEKQQKVFMNFQKSMNEGNNFFNSLNINLQIENQNDNGENFIDGDDNNNEMFENTNNNF